ncbi:MAG: efflux RND transporter permease subunit [Bdellovibrionota bacterium]
MKWTKLVIDQPVLVLMVELFLVVLGLMGLQKLGVDLYPEVDPPVITVTTEYPGAGPEEVETLVSKPIEEQLNQLGGIEKIQSTSREGLSQVVVEFQLNVDAKEAKIDVRDKLSQIRPDLPTDIEEPQVERLDFADRPIVTLALESDKDSPSQGELIALREFADRRLKPLLQQIDGVGKVELFGGLVREVQVRLDFRRMRLWKITPNEVADALTRSNRNVPAGEVREFPNSRSIRVLGEFAAVGDVGSTLVKVLPGGKRVLVKDLATVADSVEKPTSIARFGNSQVVLMEIKKQSGTNTVSVADGIDRIFPSLQKSLPDGFTLRRVYEGSRKIRMAVNDVMETLVIAALLTVAVVYLFLGSWESTLITGFALPTTLISSFYLLYLAGFTINIMTMLGLTLAVGLLLDDAIVVLENIWTKISQGMPPKEAADVGTREVFVAVIATSATILAVFIPVTLIPGVVGQFFISFAVTVCIAIVLSTFDALTVAPMLSAYVIREKKRETQQKSAKLGLVGRIDARITAFYSKILNLSLLRPMRTLLLSFGVFVASLFLVPLIGFTFLPADESGEIDIVMEAPPGVTLEKTAAIVRQLEDRIRNMDGVSFYSSRIGNEFGEVNSAVTYLRLVEDSNRDFETKDFKVLLQSKLADLVAAEELDLSLRTPGSGGGGRSISVAIQGADSAVLTELSKNAVEAIRKEVPGAVNLTRSLRDGRSEVQLYVDRTRASELGIEPAKIGEMLRGWYEGIVASKFRELGEEYDIRVQLDESQRMTAWLLETGEVYNGAGEAIPLPALVRQTAGRAPTKIIRLNQVRAGLIEGDLADGAALGTVLSGIRTVIGDRLPDGYRLKFEGQAKSLEDLRTGALTALILGALFTYMIMASLYGSFVVPMTILLTLPLAICGGVLALLLTGHMMDVYAVIGMILLMGIVTKNAILLIDYLEQLRAQGVSRKEAILEAGVRRLRPILMTTISTVVGMLPIAMGFGELNKARAGMGIAAIGGLLSSTLLSLVVVPCAYVYLDSFRWWSRGLVRKLGYNVKTVREAYETN